jgi:hypothetical protein
MPERKKKQSREKVDNYELSESQRGFTDWLTKDGMSISVLWTTRPDDKTDEVEPFIRLKHLPRLFNVLLDSDQSTIDINEAGKLINQLFKESNTNHSAVLCSHCAKKFGVKQCAACNSTSKIRYCSKTCQIAAWPTHRKSCCFRDVVDID